MEILTESDKRPFHSLYFRMIYKSGDNGKSLAFFDHRTLPTDLTTFFHATAETLRLRCPDG